MTARPHALVLDSGIGGLGIAAALRGAVPELAISYVADHGFYPYGSKDDAVLVAHLERLVGGLVRRLSPDLVVIACNTASTIALASLRARIPVPFAGCVPPVKWAASISRTRTIGLLATRATVGRDYVRELRDRFAPDCTLLAHGATGLADLAEARFAGLPLAPGAVAAELAPLLAQPGGDRIDAVCLGCTHYGLLLDELRDAAPAGIAWLDPASAVARHAARLLADTVPAGDAEDRFLLTAPPAEPAAFGRAVAAYGFPSVAVIGPDGDAAEPQCSRLTA